MTKKSYEKAEIEKKIEMCDLIQKEATEEIEHLKKEITKQLKRVMDTAVRKGELIKTLEDIKNNTYTEV